MKKTILSLVVLFCTVTSVNAQQLLKGDMNDDGDLTIGDVTALVEMIKNGERVHIDLNMGLTEADNTKLYGTWETADHESIVIFDETGAVYNNKKYSYQYYPNLQKLVLSDTESGLAKVMLFVNKESDAQISIFDNKIADFVLYDLSPEMVKVESITLSQTSLELTVDDIEAIVATVLPENAHQKVAWSSSDETVATVDENGVVTAIEEGTAIITCTATDGSGVSATCEVTITPNAILVTDITLSQSSLELFFGKTATIEATVTPDDAHNKEVIWTSSNEAVATVENGVVTAVTYGTTTITCTAKDKSGVLSTCEVRVDHEYVDLGLRSGTLWATCNIGAEDPADVGNYFAWGETSPKLSYSWSNYAHCNGTSSTITKYCTDASVWAGSGNIDGLTVLQSTDDAATQLWGSDWRMPTSGQLAELNECPRKEYVIKQYNDYSVIGVEIHNRVYGQPTIFLPIAGYINNSNIVNSDFGYYWSSWNSNSGKYTASTLQITVDNENQKLTNMNIVYKSRCFGMPIRAVRKK
ncbi:MAG: Ig domain-containing protein [Bacteroidaceae bacterium]|nr:Ig domain-containing protein [Bacteroidaceae bacterium]